MHHLSQIFDHACNVVFSIGWKGAHGPQWEQLTGTGRGTALGWRVKKSLAEGVKAILWRTARGYGKHHGALIGQKVEGSPEDVPRCVIL